ncbi:MAG: hypothetical protein MN733_02095 [Nitrososphaera sp.]|nr:hypothetical protein [Nitrososphaera sp.]
MKSLFGKYLVRPLRLIVSNPSTLLLVAIVLILDRINNDPRISATGLIPMNPSEMLDGAYLYERLPGALAHESRWQWVLLISMAFSVVQFLVAIAIMSDLKLIYQQRRKGLLNSIRQIVFRDVVWYYLWLLMVYAAFGIVAASLYLLGQWLWRSYELNIALLQLVVLCLAFPFYYAMLSVGAKIAVVPVAWRNRLSLMLVLGRIDNLLKIYLFYPIRLAVEFGCLVLVPAITLVIFHNQFLAVAAGMLTLLLPLAAFRASTFEFFLDIYRDNDQIRQVFSEYYRNVSHYSG